MGNIANRVRRLLDAEPPQPRVLGIGASPRKNGNSDMVLAQILRGLEKSSVPAESLQLRDIRFQGCIGCERCRKDKICTGLQDGMSLVYGDILSSRGLVLVSPTHNYNITAWMKAFIDRLYCFYAFTDGIPRGWSSNLAGQNRKAVIATICEQENTEDMGFTLDAMRLPLQALGYEIVAELPVFRIFDRGKVKNDSAAMTRATELGIDLGRALQN